MFLVIALCSCKRVGPGYVEGTICEDGSNIPLKDLKVKVTRSHHHNSAETVGSATSDENGYFKIKFYKRLVGYDFILWVEPDPEHMDYTEGLDTRKTKSNIFMAPKAFAKFKIENRKLDDLELVISDMRGHGIITPLKANKDTLLGDVFALNGHGTTSIRWSYTNLTTNEYSGFKYDDISIFIKGDTVLHTIIIN